MKLYQIPNFSKYRITKKGDIYHYELMKIVYRNETTNGLPKLENDEGILIQLTRNDIAAAYYGYLPNSNSESKTNNLDYSSKAISYIIDEIITISDSELLINGNIFKKIENYSRFYISEYGVIYSTIINTFRKYNTSQDYLIINIVNDDGESTDKYIHHLVYETYIGERTPKMTIHHRDERKWNNYVKNLKEVTYTENTFEARRAISNSYSTIFTHHGATWAPETLDWMCDQMANYNRSTSEICDMLGVTYERDRSRVICLLSGLRRGKVNTYISSKYDFSNYCPDELRKKSLKKYDESAYNAILYFIRKGFTNNQIAEILKIPRQTINRYRKYYYLDNKEGSTTIESIA